MGKAGSWHAPLLRNTSASLSQSAGKAGGMVRPLPGGPSASQVAPHPCPYVHTSPEAVKRPGHSLSSVPPLRQGHWAGILALPPDWDRAGNQLPEFVSWVHHAEARALGPSEFRNSVFQISGGTVWCCVWCVMVAPPQGSAQHPQVKHTVFP